MNDPQSSQQVFIRFRGKVLGPFTVDRFQELRRRGQLSRAHEVSTDRENWQSVSKLDEFILSKIPQTANNGRPPQRAAGSSGWYIQIHGEAIGPMSSDEVQELEKGGGIRPDTYVSHDAISWQHAADVHGLLVAQPLQAPVKTDRTEIRAVDRAQKKTAIHPIWIVAGISAGVLALFVIAFIALLLLGVSAEATQKEQTGRRTLEYWNQLVEILQANAGAAPNLGGIANRIDAVETADVDPEAISCGSDIAIVLRNGAAFQQQFGNPAAVFLESYFRGMAGDPFGKTVEMIDAEENFKKQVSAVQQECATIRKSLTNRYGIEFSTIPF